MHQSDRTFLVISALGPDRPGIVDQITHPIHESQGNILDSRMTVLGGEFAILMLVEGSEQAITALEQQLPELQQRSALTIMTKRTATQPINEATVPYMVSVVAIDHPGIVNQLSGFFSKRNINIQNLETDCYHAPHTGTPMFSVEMTVNIPSTVSMSKLKHEFFDFCDEMNVDATLESIKA